ncbi:uroporphyrinogen-III synthase [Sulfitobacter sp.]|uniref:uroporphyrinogen-III synthase n=1 Tax=Sulfitobacter sp. TaxID=1903071 RepID=UPI00300224E4
MAPPVLLLTRPRESAEEFATSLDSGALAGVNVVISPLLEIVSTGSKVSLSAEQAVIFSSSNGVLYSPDGMGRTAYCVGAKTTQRANARGWSAFQAGDTAQELLVTLRALDSKRELIHLAGVHTRGNIAQTLNQGGIRTRHIALYNQRLLPLEHDAVLALSGPCIVPVFSPRTGEQLIQEANGGLKDAHIVALSEAVAEPFRGEKTAGLLILGTPRAVYMGKAVEKLCRALSLP